MFKIGEFSKLTQVSIRMLRYYDQEGLLPPARTDPATGYRLYSSQQIPTLNKILFLRDIGLGVAEIRESLANWDSGTLAHRLEERQREIRQAIRVEEEKLARIHLASQDLLRQSMELHYNVVIKQVPGVHVLSLRKVIPDYYAEGTLWKEMSAFVERHRLQVSSNTFSIYHDAEYKEWDVEVELCAPTQHTGPTGNGFVFRRVEPVSHMACTMVYGPFERIKEAYLSFADWLQRHNQYRMLGESRQIVHRGPWNEENREDYLTELQIPLERR